MQAASGETRTGDILHIVQILYQLSYCMGQSCWEDWIFESYSSAKVTLPCYIEWLKLSSEETCTLQEHMYVHPYFLLLLITDEATYPIS